MNFIPCLLVQLISLYPFSSSLMIITLPNGSTHPFHPFTFPSHVHTPSNFASHFVYSLQNKKTTSFNVKFSNVKFSKPHVCTKKNFSKNKGEKEKIEIRSEMRISQGECLLFFYPSFLNNF